MIRELGTALMRIGLARKGKKMLRQLTLASQDCKGAQQRVLRQIIDTNRETAFGRDYKFNAISSPAEFASHVPIQNYEGFRPYVDRAGRGESDVLFPGKPIFYATTSGTTSKPKLIPISDDYNRRCYSGLSKLWMYMMYSTAPGYLDGFDLMLVGKGCEGYTPDGTPYGSFSGLANADTPKFAKRIRVIPFSVHEIDDFATKYYTLLRIALQHPIKWILAVNPSSLLELHRFTLHYFEQIADDIEKGTLSSELNIQDGIRREVEARLKPAPRRARELRLLRQKHDPLLPKHYWPDLKIINTWTAGNAAVYLDRTDGFYPKQTVIQEFGYMATEARAGIILEGDQRASILAAHLLFFEFIPKEERGKRSPQICLAHELVEGEEYYVIVTTPSGLYRYDINDIIRVEGFFGSFPMVRFVQKGVGVTSLTGEKLYESQYLKAVDTAAAELDVAVDFHIAFANIETSTYDVYVETANRLDSQRFGALVDADLKSSNIEYRAKRNSNRIHPPRIYPLGTNAYGRYKSWRMENGARDGQFKLVHLTDDAEQRQLFQKLSKQSAEEQESVKP